MDYARAVAALYQAPHGEFVAERKRLAAELKVAGDREGAKAIAKLGRPPISAWAVNQLYWHAREAFDRLMATAAQLRDGALSASAAHREALGRLRQRAAAILTEAGHNASEGTLRRTAQTLSAIAALGTFAPDPPGALSDDRDPPGFEAAGVVAFDRPPPMLSVAPPPAAAADDTEEADDEGDDEDDDSGVSSEEREAAAELLSALSAAKPARHLASVPETSAAPRPRHLSSVPPHVEPDGARVARERAEAEAARVAAAEATRKAEVAREKQRARERITTALRTARGEVETRRRAADALRAELARADGAIADAVAIVEDLEAELENLED